MMSDTGGATIDTATAPIAIRLTDIVKRFPGVIANDGVNLTVRQGTVHAIVGENGAGKSTLMKTLYGAHEPNEGTIEVNGELRVFSSPKDAIADGIGMVFQAFMLAANLTVWENIVLGQEPGGRSVAERQRGPHADPRPRRALRLAGRPRHTDLRPRRRRQATRRDPQGALPRRQDPDPRRAHRRARPPGSRRAVRVAARTHHRGRHHHLHLAQARRGAQARRRHHGDPPGQDRRRDSRSEHRHLTRPRRADGRQRAPDTRDPREHRDRHPGPRTVEPHGRTERGRRPQPGPRRVVHGAPRRDRRHRRRGGQRTERAGAHA